MSPNLAIVYGGASANGALGYGWSLQAGSVITRCPATIATDGRKTGVAFGIDDKLCLNGQRLVRLNTGGTPVVGLGTNDAAGLAPGSYDEFRTESDSYFRIRSYGYAKGDATGASGPAFFKVWTKAGQIIEYGASPAADANTNALTTFSGSTVGAVWSTARMSDVVGNHIDYKYEQRDVAWGSGGSTATPATGHETNLLEIQYSGNKVVFNYSDRPSTSPQDASEAYNAIGKNVSLRRLNSVTTYVNSPNVTALGPAAAAVATTTTKLTYDNGPITKRSRLTAIQTCAGAATSTRCLPGPGFAYAPGGSDAYVASATFNQSTLQMQSATGAYGVLVGDFNGDGKTDLIRWSAAAPGSNQLLLSNGDGSFTVPMNSGLTGDTLFSADGCYVTIVADFNGDGLPDLLRYSGTVSPSGTACPSPGPMLLFMAKGDGTFTRSTYTGPALERDNTANFYLLDFDGDGKTDLITSVAATYVPVPPAPGHTGGAGGSYQCTVTGGICTHVYHGNGDGTFSEMSTNIGTSSIAMLPKAGQDPNTVSRITDIDGDGLADVGAVVVSNPAVQVIGAPRANSAVAIPQSDVPRWILEASGIRSHGDGNFDLLGTTTWTCTSPIDFNGDGSADCLSPTDRSMSGGPSWMPIPNFNLTATGQELAGTGIGFVVADVNGDGRQDIIRWEDDPSKNVVYLSNGDGTFTASTSFNLAGVQLQKSDGSANFLVGDFTGHGNVEILRLQTVGGTVSNQLFVKQDSTPSDQLTSVTSASGAVTSFAYVPLANSTPTSAQSANLGPRYASDRGNAALGTVFPTVDLSLPAYVVATMVTDSGVGASQVATEMSYAGLKADARGRGMLGFRDVKRQTVGANGNPLTTDTQYLQRSPYIGSVAMKAVYNSALNATSSANLLQQTATVYCDQSSSTSDIASAISSGIACTPTATVLRPYLLYSTQTGQDLGGVALPTTTTQTSVNANADPTLVVVKTTGTVGGVSQTFTKTATTQYQPDLTICGSDHLTCSWILSRATTAAIESSVPNSIANLATSAGTAPGATSTRGTGPTQIASLNVGGLGNFGSVTIGAQPTLTATLSNTGEPALTLTAPTAASVTGTGFSFVSTNCGATVAPGSSCTITLKFAPTTQTAYTGTLTLATGAGSHTASLNGSGVAPSVTFAPVSTNWGTIGAASDSGDWPSIVNHSTVPILITSHSLASGPAGTWSYQGDSTHCQPGITVLQPGAFCQTFFGIGGLAIPGSYTATDQIGYQAVSVTSTTFTTQQTYSFAVATTTATSSGLAFGGTSPSMTTASQTFTVVNNASGSPVNIGVSMGGAQPASFPMTTTCGSSLGSGAFCNVSVSFSPSAVGNYNGAVQVSFSYPRMQAGQATSYYPATSAINVPLSGTGVGAQLSFSPASISFGNVLQYATTTLATTVTNSGNQATSVLSFTPSAYSSVSGCTSPIPASGSCNLSVSVNTQAIANYSGTITASLGNGPSVGLPWSAAAQGVALNGSGGSVSSVYVGNVATGYVSIYNSGNQLATGLSASFQPRYANGTWSVNGGSCGASLAAAASCSYAISNSGAADGNIGANFTVTTSSAGANPSSYTTLIAGVAYAAPEFTASVVFPSVAAGGTTQANVVFYNTSAATLPMTVPNAASITGAGFSVVSTNCPSQLAGKGSCITVVQFSPTTIASYSGTLNLTTVAGNSVVSLSGSGVSPTVTPFTIQSGGGLSTVFQNPNSFAITPSAAGILVSSGDSEYASITANTCLTSIPAGGTCTITFSAPVPQCMAEHYSVNAYVTDAAGTMSASTVSRSSNNTQCE